MLFHAGALWRLNECGLLAELDFISSVSGGSITAATLGARWRRLTWSDMGDGRRVASNYTEEVVQPLRRLAARTIDTRSLLGGILIPTRTVTDQIAAAYRKHLFGDATLQDLPDRPRLVITATNLQSGGLWRFSKPYMRDFRVGEVSSPRVPLATAVAASAAFPPFLSPMRLTPKDADWELPAPGESLLPHAFRRGIVLSDGGVYDNLGLEPVIKRCARILVSDGGTRLQAERRIAGDWLHQLLRVLTVVDSQVRALRKRDLIASYQRGDFTGTYWGIRTRLADYPCPSRLPHDPVFVSTLARVPTRLARLSNSLQEGLVNWGYAVSDAALRSWAEVPGELPNRLPYTGGLIPRPA
jgi:NTE family protein